MGITDRQQHALFLIMETILLLVAVILWYYFGILTGLTVDKSPWSKHRKLLQKLLQVNQKGKFKFRRMKTYKMIRKFLMLPRVNWRQIIRKIIKNQPKKHYTIQTLILVFISITINLIYKDKVSSRISHLNLKANWMMYHKKL